jgi:hypothetical protein
VNVEWAVDVASPYSKLNRIRLWMEKAQRTSLLPPERHQLLDLINHCPEVIYVCGLSPLHIPQLVENNPTVAIAVLTHLTRTAKGFDFLSALIGMEMSMNSMEVLKHLTLHNILPLDQLHLCITNCMSYCERIEKNSAKRSVQLLCLFLQSLFRAGPHTVLPLREEVEAFCILFSSVREATILYRLLKETTF